MILYSYYIRKYFANSIREHSSPFVKYVPINLFIAQYDRILTATHNNDLGIGR